VKQTEKEYRIRVTTTEEVHECIKDKLNEIYKSIKDYMPDVSDVEYYVHGKIEERKFNG